MDAKSYIADRASFENYEKFYKLADRKDLGKVTLYSEAVTGMYALEGLAREAMKRGCAYLTDIQKLAERQPYNFPIRSDSTEVQLDSGRVSTGTRFENFSDCGAVTLVGIGFFPLDQVSKKQLIEEFKR